MAELIDVLNEDGYKIGEIARNIAHIQGLWHKSVHVWVVNDKGQILLQHRCRDKKFFPSCWDCAFAGHISARENSIGSAIREGSEEIGLELTEDDFQFLFTYKDMLRSGKLVSNEFVDVFLVRKNVELDKLTLQKEEVDDVKWIDQEVFFAQIMKKEGNYLFHGEEEYIRLEEILRKDLFIE